MRVRTVRGVPAYGFAVRKGTLPGGSRRAISDVAQPSISCAFSACKSPPLTESPPQTYTHSPPRSPPNHKICGRNCDCPIVVGRHANEPSSAAPCTEYGLVRHHRRPHAWPYEAITWRTPAQRSYLLNLILASCSAVPSNDLRAAGHFSEAIIVEGNKKETKNMTSSRHAAMSSLCKAESRRPTLHADSIH